jgi:hypothetical protein
MSIISLATRGVLAFTSKLGITGIEDSLHFSEKTTNFTNGVLIGTAVFNYGKYTYYLNFAAGSAQDLVTYSAALWNAAEKNSHKKNTTESTVSTITGTLPAIGGIYTAVTFVTGLFKEPASVMSYIYGIASPYVYAHSGNTLLFIPISLQNTQHIHRTAPGTLRTIWSFDGVKNIRDHISKYV